jgi:hypothetical protein
MVTISIKTTKLKTPSGKTAGNIQNHKSMLRRQVVRDLIDGNRGTRENRLRTPYIYPVRRAKVFLTGFTDFPIIFCQLLRIAFMYLLGYNVT